ncbi:ABC transporter ATP-binding protein [Candidatus Nitrosoglobus terrae]|uniref:ABC transporter ATP-binding protein n=1 Tax=Candidatus Nitrosoglobus terrae TaxID=1630141 RepID=A0A1Q2SK30_9GAMM|nr:dipeptide ABC transporter ATP-binding protein [Candidatus Nitrosoglobus terrae]BAW79477.1 ABC transporter ATP-binding protein [Candidatus Nitrosoglobus terrae]
MLLQVNNLKTYLRTGNKTIKAVDGVSFTIDRGETFCLVGESGSGKSITALSVIQLLPQNISSHPDGQILFDWRHNNGQHETVDLLHLSEPRKRKIRGARIAMIFQEPMTCLNPVFTIGEQIIEALQLHFPNMDEFEARERTIAALDQVQIPNPAQRIDEYPHRLSGGQRQRVMIAMAMACEPDLLIADEPTTALDVTIQAEILRLMRELQTRRNMGILFITHDFGVVSQIAHQLAVMRLGKIVESGSLKDVLHHPQHIYTRQLLAALPENLKHHKTTAKTINTTTITEDPPLLELRQLQVHFPIRKGILQRTAGYVRAVDGINLIIPVGQIFGLVGESGCGKTTLGRAILRLVEPTGGQICYAGTNLATLRHNELRRYRRELQIIFQDPLSSLNPRLTIATTLTEPMAAHGIGGSPQDRLDRASALLQQVHLKEDYLWRYPHEFSGGQRQRICIARALALEPRFIVCDEITSALDVSMQAEILELLLELQYKRNLTLLFITHNIGVVRYISNKLAIMRSGRIIEQGSTEHIYQAPTHPYTQKLLESVPKVVL